MPSLRTLLVIALLLAVGAAGVFALRGGDELASLSGHPAVVRAVAWSDDGRLLASSDDAGGVWVWDAVALSKLRELPGHAKAVRGLAFAPGSHRLASASDDRDVKVWDADAGTELMHLHDSPKAVECVAFGPDGKTVIAGGADHLVRVWDAAGKPVHTLKGHPKHVHAVAAAADGRFASGCSGGTVRLWDATGKPAGEWKVRGGHINALAFAPDGKSVYAAGSGTGLRRWDVGTRTEKPFAGPVGLAMAVAAGPDGTVASAHEDGAVRVWDSAAGTLAAERRGHRGAAVCVAVSPDGRRLATGGADRTLKIWAAKERP